MGTQYCVYASDQVATQDSDPPFTLPPPWSLGSTLFPITSRNAILIEMLPRLQFPNGEVCCVISLCCDVNL